MKIRISTADLVICLSDAVDLISSLVSNHHKYVSIIAYQLGAELGLKESELKDITYSAAIHDVGALSLSERLDAYQFDYEDDIGHSERGYLLLNSYKPFANIANIIRYHHTSWNNGKCKGYDNEEVPYASHLLNLADRVAVLIKSNNNILGQAEDIRRKISGLSGKAFVPEIVDAFLNISKKEAFWLNIISYSLSEYVKGKFKDDIRLDKYDFLELIKLFSRIIDFRSRFTATHSSGVAKSAKALSKFAGFSKSDMELMEIAGYIHDLGKLAIPTEILEKKEQLSRQEYEIIRTHTYYTDLILLKVKDFDLIRIWGALHHERLNGMGYPFHFTDKQLSIGSRIMAVADVFTALSEDRPYRKGLSREDALNIIIKMAANNSLDNDIVNLLREHFNYINNQRIKAQKTVENEYISLQTKRKKYSHIA